MGNKSSGAIFGTFICRFHISTALSELKLPLLESQEHNWALSRIEATLTSGIYSMIKK